MSEGGRSGVLIITPEPVAQRMAGPAIRALELARALARDGRSGPVTLMSLAAVDRWDSQVTLTAAPGEAALRDLVSTAAVVLIQGDVLGLHPWLVDEPVPIVVDAYDPYHLEQLEQARSLGEAERRAVVRDCIRSLNTQLARADLVLCASARQRALWIGHLAALGRVNPLTYDEAPDLSRLVTVVPFGVPEATAPRRDRTVLQRTFPAISDEDVVLIWGGGVYEWFDPEVLVRAVARVLPEHPHLRLVFLGTRHPVAGVRTATDAAREAAVETGTLDRAVFFHEGWVPYDERGHWLAAADLGVSTHKDHVETEFSFRTRLLDYLWCGLPVISTGGDDLAEHIAGEGAGVTVPAGDLEALASAIDRAVRDEDWRGRSGAAAAALGKVYAWDRVTVPLADFCAAPVRSPDLALDRIDRLQVGLDGSTGHARIMDRVRAGWREGGPGLLVRRAWARMRRMR
ncbi:glycosyltransferase [Blastococcus sp. CT_GayMR16]|uniref:glycosyltransferase n=1 Tax=Blastococcus sp. CT_GayMR16 TaxID=2559607 RepID=UPI0010740A9F|nr:glycosyltransferase [Blastococcus sp. CT_GayMR16]TFV87774.1 glycosyltransferase [Blastococcus sp. CT_GayMR16]